MQKNEKSKKERLKKLHLILDKPSRGDLHPKDEKYLQALSKRLESSSKKSIVCIHRTSEEREKETDSLRPRVTIHYKEEKKSVVYVKYGEPEGRKKSLFEDENLYEVEKVEVKGPEFLEVKPKEAAKEEEKIPAEKPIEELESEITKKTKEDASEEQLPEWEPVDIKKTETKVEETKDEKSESKDELPPSVGEKTEFIEEEFFEEELDLKEELPLTEKREKEKEEFSPNASKIVFLAPDSSIPGVERDSKIDVFRDIESIDEKTAVLLYDNGFTSIDAVKRASLKDLTRINGVKRKLAKNIKKEIEEKLESIASENEDGNKVEEFGEHFLIDEKIEEDETRKDEKTGVFKDIGSIDEKTASLLYENGITSIDILKETPIKKLTKIKGIKRKLAKGIKKEIDEIVKKNKENIDHLTIEEDNPFIEEDVGEWDSYEEDEIPEQKEVKSYRYGNYTLYKKEIKTSSGKKRTVHFFSKTEPDEGVSVKLPADFEIKVNKKTGVPYLRKKSKKK